MNIDNQACLTLSINIFTADNQWTFELWYWVERGLVVFHGIPCYWQNDLSKSLTTMCTLVEELSYYGCSYVAKFRFSFTIHIQSHLICIQPNLIYIQSAYICSFSSYLYSVSLYMFPLPYFHWVWPYLYPLNLLLDLLIHYPLVQYNFIR